jgi:hypothetical protein
VIIYSGNVMSTERLRETVRKEGRLVKKHAENSEEEIEEEIDGAWQTASSTLAPQNLYDVVNRVPDVSLKYRRDDRQVLQGPSNAAPVQSARGCETVRQDKINSVDWMKK